MKVRNAIERDIPQIVQIIIEYKTDQNFSFNNEKIEKTKISLEKSISNDENILIVCINSETDLVMGFINVHILDFPLLQGKELYISDLVVKGEQRGRGIGTALIHYAEKIAIENNCVRMMLNNYKDSKAYEKEFYKKKEFIERENIANFVKNL